MSKKKQINQKKPNKKRFELAERETIDQCLARIKSEGYLPVRRTEKPIFELDEKDGAEHVKPIGRQVIFDAILDKHER